MSWLFPPKKDFLKMLLNQAEKVEEGLGALQKFLEAPTSDNEKAVDHIEEEADELRRITADELNRSFVTPIDREDISALSRAVDDIMDYANSTAEEMMLFGIEPNARMKKMVDTIHGGAREITHAIKNLREHPGVCLDHLRIARKAENSVEHGYREGLVELFQTEDVITILKTREIYRHLSNAADRIVESADIIGDILVKIS